jgi:hypothetical protein
MAPIVQFPGVLLLASSSLFAQLSVRCVGVGSYSLLNAVAAAGTALALPTQARIVYESPTAPEQVHQLDHQNGYNH